MNKPIPSVREARLTASLSLPHIVALYVGSVVGSGILMVPGLAADLAGPASIVAWLLMSVLVVPLALTMGLLASRYPSAGGVSTFVREAYGNRAGNIAGWLFLLSVPLGGPVLAVTGARYVSVLLGWGALQTYTLAALILIVPLAMNVFGLRLAGRIQTVVVAVILAILLLAIGAAVPHYEAANFTPFAPHGWGSVARAACLMFWCFIGWEAVTHLSSEFRNPRRDAVHGVLWSAGVVAALYFAVAFLAVATRSYGGAGSAASLSLMVQLSLGKTGGWMVAVAALFICFAAHNAYSSAASRVAYSLAQAGAAPAWLGRLHRSYRTPVGGLAFVAAGNAIGLAALCSGWITLAGLIVLPNATFIATYIAGCLAGVKLLRGHRLGYAVSWISCVATLAIYPFLGWPALYPAAVVALLLIAGRVRERRAITSRGVLEGRRQIAVNRTENEPRP
ncbi:APC family permease [Paenibacillus aurantiacus]|uniref:APC family permease n=1 Tax=Paenibacillus aurantiacus TaxID=1936118 RepID=A0ABV5KLS4_9BACL